VTDGDGRGAAERPPLNDTQRRIVDAAFEADAGLFVQASVPGSGKTYASGRLCADFLLQRAAAGVNCPAAGLAAVAEPPSAFQQNSTRGSRMTLRSKPDSRVTLLLRHDCNLCDLKPSTTTGTIDNLDIPPVRVGNHINDRKPKARSIF